ncbi:MAG: hypothetical protein ABUL44_01645, partial [Flavobacterium sp.]
VSGNDTLRIYMITKKTYCDMNGGFYWDILTGWHIYKKGNVIIERSYNNVSGVFYANTLSMHNEGLAANVCGGSLTDITKNKSGDLTLTLNTAGTQLTWKLINSPGLKVTFAGDPPYDRTFTLPENIVLTKL